MPLLPNPIKLVWLEGADHDSDDEDQDRPPPKYMLNPDALKFLNNLETPLCVISIAGLYRTGKSFLLNQLAGYKKGFSLGSTVEPCTQGIWMWDVEVTDEDGRKKTCILLDTEGLGSYNKTESYDVQIFSLALLLGSYFIYNSLNSIDETAIDKLSLVVQLTKHIRAQAEGDADPLRLKMYFPSFLWLVRDFSLELNIEGRVVTPREYLEQALQSVKGDPKRVAGKNEIRDFIKQFFADRDCYTLKRPVADENKLQRLGELGENELRKEYLEQVNELKHLIYNKVQLKKINGHPLNGPMLVELARSYISAINMGGVPTINTAWENVIHQECQKALAQSATMYKTIMGDFLKEKGVAEQDELFALHKKTENEAFDLLRLKSVGGPQPEYEKELKKIVDDFYDKIFRENYDKSAEDCEGLISAYTKHIDDFIASGDIDKLEKLEEEWEHRLDTYHKTARGPAKYVVEAKLLAKKPLETARKAHNQIVEKVTFKQEQMRKEERQKAAQEYERLDNLYKDQIKTRTVLEEKVDKLEKQNQQLGDTAEKLEKENKNLLAENYKLNKKLAKLEIEKEEVDKAKLQAEAAVVAVSEEKKKIEAAHTKKGNCIMQ